MREMDAMIAGGGPAGATAAALLAGSGKRTVLVEQTAVPHHKVCGEFLSHEVLHYLRSAGIDPLQLGALPITRVRLAADNLIAEQELPFEAASLSRKTLDSALLQHAQRCGAHLVTGRRVEALCSEGGSWQMLLSDGSFLHAPHAFLASGKHDLRGHLRGSGRQPGLIALKVHLQLSPEQMRKLQGSVEIVLFPSGYLGLQPAEGGFANLCLLIEAKQFRALGSSWAAALAHLKASSRFLRERLAGAQEVFPRPLALSHIPYGYVRGENAKGLWPLGDQIAVIPSFSGDGMAIALHTAHVAASYLLSGSDSAAYMERVREDLASRVSGATHLSRVMVSMPYLAHALSWCPSLLAKIASSTRIPHSSLAFPTLFQRRAA